MGQGRKPKTIRERQLDGSLPKNIRAADVADEPVGDEPQCPPWIKGASRIAWSRMACVMRLIGRFDARDQVALELFSEAYGLWRTDDRATVKQESSRIMRWFLSEYGLTPASMLRVPPPAKPDDETPSLRAFAAGKTA